VRFALAALLLLAAAEARALRGDDRVVDIGDHAIQVRERCGEPFWIDADAELLVQGEHGPLGVQHARRAARSGPLPRRRIPCQPFPFTEQAALALFTPRSQRRRAHATL
jgi:hypothetical protein